MPHKAVHEWMVVSSTRYQHSSEFVLKRLWIWWNRISTYFIPINLLNNKSNGISYFDLGIAICFIILKQKFSTLKLNQLFLTLRLIYCGCKCSPHWELSPLPSKWVLIGFRNENNSRNEHCSVWSRNSTLKNIIKSLLKYQLGSIT